MRRIPVALVVTALLLAGCTTTAGAAPVAPSPSPSLEPSPISTPNAEDPPALGLVGMWRVSGAAGEGRDTWLRISTDQTMLWSRCGVFFVDLDTSGHQLIFDSSSSGPLRCKLVHGRLPVPGWLSMVTGFAADGTDQKHWNLLDPAGSVVARLGIDGHPPTSKNYLDSFTETPSVTAKDRSEFSRRAPLPRGATPFSNLIGRWVPVTAAPTHPFVMFSTDGGWSGSDGCNSVGGRWVTAPDGGLLVTSGASTNVGCKGSALPYWAALAARTAMIDGKLTFFDRVGKRLGQAVRG